MTKYYSEGENASESSAQSVREAFSALPFEKKISTLIRIELDMLGDAFNAVVSAAAKAADEISDALSGEPCASEQSSPGGQAPTS